MHVAAIDIGTNSTRLLVAEVVDGTVEEIERTTRVTGLGRGVDASGRLADDAIERTVATLADYGQRIRELSVPAARAVATSASRDAANSDVFLDAAAEVLGFRPEVVSGAEEAGLAFAGAGAVARDPASALIVDIGGGSTEFVTSRGGHSVDIGSVRLTDRYFAERPVDFERLVGAARAAAGVLADLPVPEPIGEVIAVAGTWTSLSAIALGLEAYDRARVHRSSLSRLDVDRLVVSLAARTVEETAQIPSLDPARAPVILGGSIVARECFRRLGIERVVVSEQDLLDGVAMRLAGA